MRSISAIVSKAVRATGGPFNDFILAGGEVDRFHDPARPHLRPENVDIALDIDRYDLAARVEYENGRPVARIEKPA